MVQILIFLLIVAFFYNYLFKIFIKDFFINSYISLDLTPIQKGQSIKVLSTFLFKFFIKLY